MKSEEEIREILRQYLEIQQKFKEMSKNGYNHSSPKLNAQILMLKRILDES